MDTTAFLPSNPSLDNNNSNSSSNSPQDNNTVDNSNEGNLNQNNNGETSASAANPPSSTSPSSSQLPPPPPLISGNPTQVPLVSQGNEVAGQFKSLSPQQQTPETNNNIPSNTNNTLPGTSNPSTATNSSSTMPPLFQNPMAAFPQQQQQQSSSPLQPKLSPSSSPPPNTQQLPQSTTTTSNTQPFMPSPSSSTMPTSIHAINNLANMASASPPNAGSNMMPIVGSDSPNANNNNNNNPNDQQLVRSSSFLEKGTKYVDLTDYLALPQTEAARRLGIPTSTLSKRWKEAVVNRKWPYRMVCKLNKEIMTLLHNVPQGPGAPPLPPEVEQSLGVLLRRRQEELRGVVIRI